MLAAGWIHSPRDLPFARPCPNRQAHRLDRVVPEWVDDIDNFPANFEEEVQVNVWLEGATGLGYLSFINLGTHKGISMRIAPPFGTQFKGNSAEWIVEAPEDSNHPTNLVPYSTKTFTYGRGNVNGGNTYFIPQQAPAPASGTFRAFSRLRDVYTLRVFSDQQREQVPSSHQILFGISSVYGLRSF